MKSPNRLTPVVFGTMTIVILSVFPVINLLQLICCMNAVLGGVVAAKVFEKELKKVNQKFEYKDGIIMGILTGVLSAVIVTAASQSIFLFSSENPIIEMTAMFEQMNMQITPEMNEIINRLSNEYSDHGFSPTLAIAELVSRLISHSLFAVIGAVIYISIINKKKGNELPTTTPQV
ncbi:MAG TPA: hypothetical protein PLG90_08595 [Ignavibacteria bacterium]|nr:hypothetical protein [Ignavibacteria bacterium]